MKKDININTAAFSLTIHWNSHVFFTQVSILFGVGLLSVFASDNTQISLLCKVVMIVDAVSCLWCLFKGNSSGEESAEQSVQQSDTPSHEAPPQVDSTSSTNSRRRRNTAPVPQEISNKLDLARPRPGATPPQPSPMPAQVPVIIPSIESIPIPENAPDPASFSELFSAADTVEMPPTEEVPMDDAMDFDFDFDFGDMG